MEIEAYRQNDELLAAVEVPISLDRSLSDSSGSRTSESNEFLDSAGNSKSGKDSGGSRRNSTESSGSKRIGTRRNSKPDLQKKTSSGGQSGGSSAGGGSFAQKVPPATAFKKDAIKKGFGDRKSRAAQGRGLPKKQGGGGSFTWGKPGCELNEDKKITATERADYDPFEDPDIIFDALEIEPTTEEMTTNLDELIGEYFNNANLDEFLESIESLLVRRERNRILERLVEVSLEHKNEYRELCSKAILFFVDQQYWDQVDVARALVNLLDRLSDLILDTPDAPEILGKFIARADSEDCLPADFIDEERIRAHESLSKRCMDFCYALTKDQRSVQTCWGTATGGFSDTSILSDKIRELLKEFILSGDKDEATRCLKDLDVPHYHHELVYESILISMESEDDRVINSMTWLLQYMSKEGVVSIDQMHGGFCRFYANVDDIVLDIPHVYNQLEKMVQRVAQRNLISSKVRLMCPNRSRKRFSSESDIHSPMRGFPTFQEISDIRGSAERPRLSSVGVQSGLDSLPEDIQIE